MISNNMTKEAPPLRNNMLLELHVPNFQTVIDFYTMLGFSVIDEEPPSDNKCGYLELQSTDALLGDTHLNFYGGINKVSEHRFFAQFETKTPRGYGVEITLPVSNLEERFTNIQANLPDSIIEPITMRSWGKRDFRILDPFGYYLRFSENVNWGQR